MLEEKGVLCVIPNCFERGAATRRTTCTKVLQVKGSKFVGPSQVVGFFFYLFSLNLLVLYF